MNGVGLTTVGQLLGHNKRHTTAVYAYLDDAALQDSAAQVAGVISEAMRYKAETPPLTDVNSRDRDNVVGVSSPSRRMDGKCSKERRRIPWTKVTEERPDRETSSGDAKYPLPTSPLTPCLNSSALRSVGVECILYGNRQQHMLGTSQ